MRWAVLVLAGCGRLAFDPQSDGGRTPPLPATWGEYAATLDVRECTGAELVVNDLTDALDGGTTVAAPEMAGTTLSFVEAMTIANNRAGTDVIRFDPAVFPVDAPATIVISAAAISPLALADVCIDGRMRGVIINWAACPNSLCPPMLQSKSLLVGVTYLDTMNEMVVYDSQVAGVRFGTDGLTTRQSQRPWAIELDGSAGNMTILGPGNAIASSLYAVRVFGGDADVLRVYDNYIGFDPLTRVVLPTPAGFDLRDQVVSNPLVIEGNVVTVASSVVDVPAAVGYPISILGNHIGVDRDNVPIAGAFGGLALRNSTWTVSDNVIANVGIAILLDIANATLRRNIITASSAAIEYTTAPPISPPAIDTATPTRIAGACASGTIEVFADPGMLAAQFLGETACNAGRFALDGSFSAGVNALASQTTTATSELSAPVLIQ